MSPTRTSRILWIVNHRTLVQAEVPLLQKLGYEVLIPKVIPEDDPEYRSGVVTYEYDGQLSLSSAAIRVLNLHDFYRRRWSPTLTALLNEHFDVVVASISRYLAPLGEAVRNFEGTVIARIFGREYPRRYTEFFLPPTTAPPLAAIADMGDRFIFGQAFHNLAEIEDSPLRDRAHTITVPLPGFVYDRAGTWVGDGEHVIFVCPGIMETGYYQDQYQNIKRHFGDLPLRIFGRQVIPIDDPSVLHYLTDDELLDLYASAPAFVYPSREPRHVHYSPLEAMVVGTPVLYRRGALIDTLNGHADVAGACSDIDEMHRKAQALLAGDRGLAEEIRATQGAVLETFSTELATRQWSDVLVPGTAR
jgi:hypothetical protein